MKHKLNPVVQASLSLAILLATSLPVTAQTKPGKVEVRPKAELQTLKPVAPKDQATADDKGQKQSAPANNPVAGPAVSVGNRAGVSTNLQGTRKDKGADSDVLNQSAAGAASQARQDAVNGLNANINARPGFDQGFQNNDAVNQKAKDAAGSFSGNPLNALTGGRDNSGSGPTGIGAQGKGAISSGGLTSASGAQVGADGDVRSPVTAAEAEKRAREAGIPATSGGVMKAISSVGSGPAGEMLRQIDAEEAGTPATAPATAVAPASEPPLRASNPNFKLFPSGASSEKSEDGNTVTHTSADEKTVTKVTTDPKTGDKTVVKTVTNDDGTKTTTTTSTAADSETPCDPTLDGCNNPAAREAFLRNHSASAQQIKQSQSGAGTVDPGRGDSTAFSVDAGATVPSSSVTGRNLFGQPGTVPRDGGGTGGGGPDFNGNLGAIDPGPDANIVGTGRQDDPGDVFNSQPGPQGIGSRASPTTGSSTQTSANSREDCEQGQGKTKRLLPVGVAAKKKADCGQ